MPIYTIQDSVTGKRMKVKGATPPSATDIEELFNSVQTPINEKKSLGGFVKNIGTSLKENSKAMVYPILHPVDTAKGLSELALETSSFVSPAPFLNKFVEKKLGFNPENDKLNAIKDMYVDRYGGLDKIGNTLYNDPVGVALDVSTLAGVGAAGNTGKFAGTLGKVSRVTDPFESTARLAGKGFKIGVGNKVGNKVAKAGKSLEKYGKDYGIKSTRINQTHQNNFNRLGEDMGDFIARNDLYGQDLKAVDEFIEPLQDKFDDLAIRSGKKVSKTELISEFENKIHDLRFDESGLPTLDPEQLKLADFMDSQLEQIKTLPDEVGLDYLTRQRRSIDRHTPDAKFNQSGYDRQKMLGSTYRGKVNEVAGTTQLGQELNKAYTFRTGLEKAPKGKGNLPLGLNKGAWATVGAVTNKFPVVGPILSAGVETFVNNPKVIGATSKGIQKTGKSLQNLQFPSAVSTFTKGAYNTGKYNSRINPTTNNEVSTPQISNTPQVTNQTQTPEPVNTFSQTYKKSKNYKDLKLPTYKSNKVNLSY